MIFGAMTSHGWVTFAFSDTETTIRYKSHHHVRINENLSITSASKSSVHPSFILYYPQVIY